MNNLIRPSGILDAASADSHSPEEKLAFEQQVRPYAALHAIYLGVNVGFKPGLMDQIREILKGSKIL